MSFRPGGVSGGAIVGPIQLVIPGAGQVAHFGVNGDAQYFHFNGFGFGAVGDDVSVPYIASENATAQDIGIKMQAGTIAQGVANLQAYTSTNAAHPILQVTADDDIKLIAGLSNTSTDRTKTIHLRATNGVAFEDFAGVVRAAFFGEGRS